MTADTVMPDPITAGTTITYTRTYADFPASSWALKLILAGKSILAVDAVASGSDFVITITPAQSAILDAGNYQWVERVTSAGVVHDAASGTVVVKPNLATASAGSLQSADEKMLEIVELAISGQLTDGIASYQIAGRMVSKIPIDELLRLRTGLRQAVKAAGTGTPSRPVRFRFPGTRNEV